MGNCKIQWDVSNAVSNRRMWCRKAPGACKTIEYSAVEKN